MTAAATLDRLAEIGVVPVVTFDDPERAIPVGAALARGGLPAAEITLRTAAGLAAIERLRSAGTGLLVGAGTVLTVAQARDAVAAGATFLASPGYDDDVVAWSLEHDVLLLAGVATPTEMLRALRAGLGVVKFFPAEVSGGVAMLAATSAVYPELRYVPTGGIGPSNLADYLRLDRVAAVGGSWMVDRSAIAATDVDSIEARARQAAVAVTDARA